MLDLNWNAVYGFWLVARQGSFTAAARLLPWGSVQALHKRIRILEGADNLNLRLLKSRGVKGVELTESGRRFYEHIDTVFRSSELLLEELRGEDTGALSIGMSSFVATNYGAQILQAYRAKLPRVSVKVLIRGSSLEVFGLVKEEKVDFAICTPPEASTSLNAVATVPLLVALVARQGQWKRNAMLTWETIVAEPLVLLDRGSLLRESIEGLLHRKGLLSRLRVTVEVSDPRLAVEAVRAGYGSAIVPVGPELLKGMSGIVRRPLPPGLPAFTLTILHSSNIYLAKYAREFVNTCALVLNGERTR